MKTRIDDLPIVLVSRLVARGEISRDSLTARLRFADDGVEYGVRRGRRAFCG
jgi:hypothetical protein